MNFWMRMCESHCLHNLPIHIPLVGLVQQLNQFEHNSLIKFALPTFNVFG